MSHGFLMPAIIISPCSVPHCPIEESLSILISQSCLYEEEGDSLSRISRLALSTARVCTYEYNVNHVHIGYT